MAVTGTARIPERGRIEVDVETVAGANVDGRADPGSVRGGVADAAGHATLTVTHGPGAAPTTIHVYARLDGRSGMADVAVPVVRSLRLHSAGRVDRPGVSCSLPERCEIWFDADTGTVHASGLPDGTVVTADGREGSVVGGALSISLDPLTLLDRQPIARTLRDLVSVSIDLTVRLPESASTEEGWSSPGSAPKYLCHPMATSWPLRCGWAPIMPPCCLLARQKAMIPRS